MTQTDRLIADYYTVSEAAALLRLRPSTVKYYNRRGILPRSVTVGRATLVHRDDLLRVLRLGTRAILAQLRYAADDRNRAGIADPEASAREAAQRARARSDVLQAQLRQVRQRDVTELDAQPPTPPLSDTLPEIWELEPLRVLLLIRELGSKAVNSMTNAELFELHRRMTQLMQIAPAAEHTNGKPSEISLGLSRLANRVDTLMPPPPPAPTLPPPPPPPPSPPPGTTWP